MLHLTFTHHAVEMVDLVPQLLHTILQCCAGTILSKLQAFIVFTMETLQNAHTWLIEVHTNTAPQKLVAMETFNLILTTEMLETL